MKMSRVADRVAQLSSCLRGYFKDARYFNGDLPVLRQLQDSSSYLLDFADPSCRKLIVRTHTNAAHEFKVLAALHANSKHSQSVPVAQPHVLIDDASVIGAPFYVCDYVDGRSYDDASEDGETRNALHTAVADTAALLHSFDYTAVGLGSTGGGSGFLARETAAAAAQFRTVDEKALWHAGFADPMEWLAQWLPAALPPDDDLTRLVHADLHVGKFIFEPTERTVAAGENIHFLKRTCPV